MASCGKDNRTVLWNTASGQYMGELSVSQNWIVDVEWSPKYPDLVTTSSFDGNGSKVSLQDDTAAPNQPQLNATLQSTLRKHHHANNSNADSDSGDIKSNGFSDIGDSSINGDSDSGDSNSRHGIESPILRIIVLAISGGRRRMGDAPSSDPTNDIFKRACNTCRLPKCLTRHSSECDSTRVLGDGGVWGGRG